MANSLSLESACFFITRDSVMWRMNILHSQRFRVVVLIAARAELHVFALTPGGYNLGLVFSNGDADLRMRVERNTFAESASRRARNNTRLFSNLYDCGRFSVAQDAERNSGMCARRTAWLMRQQTTPNLVSRGEKKRKREKTDAIFVCIEKSKAPEAIE